MKLSRVLARVVLAGFLTLGLGNVSVAGLISSVTSSNNAVASVTSVSSTTYNHVANGTGTGTATIDLEVFQLHVPIQLTINYDARGVLPDRTDYTITLRVKNSIANVGQSLDFNGFDLTNGATDGLGAASAGIQGNVAPTSNVFSVLYSGAVNIAGGFRWGGLSGGGARLAPGATATNTFVYRVNWASSAAGSSTLNFTANPEPATLLLGSLVLAPAVWVVRRRRKAAAAGLEATAV
jgi:hypothetical protein